MRIKMNKKQEIQKTKEFNEIKDELFRGLEKVLEKEKITVNMYMNILMYLIAETLISIHNDYEDVRNELTNVFKHLAANTQIMFKERQRIDDAPSDTSGKG